MATLRFSGSALYAQWIHSGGTVTLSGNQRTWTLTPSQNLIDATAANDSFMERIAGLKDFTTSFSLLPPSDTYISIEDAVAEGTNGTLIVAPWGTASSARKYTLPVVSNGANVNVPYNDIVEMSIDFTGASAMTRGTYA
jgi:hypothetical protein